MENNISLSEAIEVVKQHLKKDANYRQTWVDNISVCVQDVLEMAEVTDNNRKSLGDFSAIRFLDILTMPTPKRLQWQYKTRQMEDWKDISESEYEASKHLVRFEFRRIEK